MTTTIYLITVAVMFGTILAVFGMRYVAQIVQAKARADSEKALRDLVERAADNDAKIQAALGQIAADAAETKARLAAVETLLKSV